MRQQLIVGPRLGDVIGGAGFESGARHVNRAVSGDENDGELRRARLHFLQQLEAVAARQVYVEQQQIERALQQQREAGIAIARAGDVIALGGEKELESFANLLFVVDNEDEAFGHNSELRTQNSELQESTPEIPRCIRRWRILLGMTRVAHGD